MNTRPETNRPGNASGAESICGRRDHEPAEPDAPSDSATPPIDPIELLAPPLVMHAHGGNSPTLLNPSVYPAAAHSTHSADSAGSDGSDGSDDSYESDGYDRSDKSLSPEINSLEKPGFKVEKIYDESNNLTRLIKRGENSWSETNFDSATGNPIRIFEASCMPDGSSMTREIEYKGDKSTETVAVVSNDGELQRTILRESIGIRTYFQVQTEYKKNGEPATTVHHHMDRLTGKLLHREQIRWQKDGQRNLTENFYFTARGSVQKYVKVLYHANGVPFVEEITRYGESGKLSRREIIQFNALGIQTAADLTSYDDKGLVVESSTTYYAHRHNLMDSLDPKE